MNRFLIRFLTVTAILSSIIFAMASLSSANDNEGRIYGKLFTVDGEVYEGLIRWDKNEGCWADILDGNKDNDRKNRRHFNKSNRRKYKKGGTSVKLFGIALGGSDNNFVSWSNSAQSGIRFGHIKIMEMIDDDRVLLHLKSGEEIELSNGSTDIGSAIREIVIEDINEGEIEFDWDDLDRIEFSEAGDGIESNFGKRLYGTLTTRRGQEFKGFVCWDIDEIFENDVLDGDQKQRSRKIKFGKIAAIERYGSRGAQVTLKNGDELILKGSNDVDERNNGIVIGDPGFGQVTVQWDEFDKVIFSEQDVEIDYSNFDGGKPLQGTVYSEDGEEYSGTIRWDDDEEYTWEILDGEYKDIEFDIEFGLIKEIEKRSRRSALVTVLDGRTFRLRGSNDVDSDNKGIIITMDDGEDVFIDWGDFEKVEFVN